jgi:hypothetical protein
MRLFQDVRMRYTWLAGQNSLDEMTTHDVELGTTVNFPNFLFSGRPLHVSPVFVFHFWDGPDGEPLPANVYSTYLEFGWQPMLTPQFGADVVASVGVFSDFGTLTSDSLRLQGTGLLVLNLTPTLTLKGGIAYLDRVDVEYLPAAGILWQPNPQTRFDIFFPKPKLSQYLGTLGNTDIWWYLTGEYGGGSWTLESVGTMDINDIRVGGGLEWTCQSGLKSFVEAAYVFDREIVYKSGVPNQTLADTVMLRGGITY